MKKELTPIQELLSCEICGRTILKGERTEAYLAPDGSRRLVCDLCVLRAGSAGWIRESAHADLPTAAPRSSPRPSLRDRLRKWRGENGAGAGGVAPEAESGYAQAEPGELEYAEDREPPAGTYEGEPEPIAEGASYEPEPEPEPAPEPPRPRERAPGPRDPRHVRAIPTNSEVKVERALDVFNASDDHRTIAGLVRTLGQPWVTAVPILESPSEVTVLVAWELSWYQYRVDLGDIGRSVVLVAKGQEINEIEPELREWNGSVTADGSLVPGAGSER